MTAVFSQELLANSTFKWEDLAGKELVIRVGNSPDELGKGVHLTVLGVDKTTGKCYVLVNEFKRGEDV
jgi:hypothetical protein